MKKHYRYLIFPLFFLLLFAENILADGFIVIDRPFPRSEQRPINPFPLVVKFHHVNVKIKGETAVTFIDQEFYNPTTRRLEGIYIFPVPKGAVINKFSMFINGEETEAELLDAKKARKIYEDIVRRQLDPAILEYEGLDIFKARIFPIEPHSIKRVKISYNEILQKDNGTIEYIYPLNTEKFSSKPLNDVVINVDIKNKSIIKNIYCASHKVDIIRKGNYQALVSYEERNVKPDTDFKLYYNTDRSKFGITLLTYRKSGEDGYFFLSANPGLITSEKINEKDITFALDVSGSMAGEKLKQAQKALLFCIENLNKGDRFQIIRFSTDAEALFKRLRNVDEKSQKKAREFINDLKAIGGTNIDEALKLSLKAKTDKSRPHMVIFITDGKPTIGITDEDTLVKSIKSVNISNTRIFTFGIGYEINTHLLDKITGLTKAYRTYISPKEDIEKKISNFYSKVQSPILTNINISFGSNIKVFKRYPRDLPDLFSGSSLVILGLYKGKGKTKITLSGKIKEKIHNYNYDVHFTTNDSKNDFIPPLWAARRIGYLLDQIRLHGEDKELIDEITELARNHGIITPYTSFLILEDERKRVSVRELNDDHQTLGGIAPNAPVLTAKSKKEYYNMKKKSGKGSIQASEEFQALNKAENSAQTRQGNSRLNYRNNKGRIVNINKQIKNIQGRAIYNTGKYWVDSRLQYEKINKVVRIQFGSKKYFNLLRKNLLSAKFLALGKNVKFIINDTSYEIFE